MSEDSTDRDAILGNSWSCQRDENGRFLSTSGRPVGAISRTTRAASAALQSLEPLAYEQLKSLLAAGHPETVRFVISNLLPAGGRAIQLDSLDADGLLDAVAKGAISPAELRSIASGVEKIRNVESLATVQERLAEIERLLKDGSL